MVSRRTSKVRRMAALPLLLTQSEGLHPPISPQPQRPPPPRQPKLAVAGPAELVTCDQTIEQGYKQVKHELGWADFQVRSDRAIRRHWQLVACAFSFCWRAWFAEHPAQPAPAEPAAAPTGAARGEATGQPRQPAQGSLVAGDAAPGARLADPVGRAGALVAGMVTSAPAGPAAAAA